MLYRLSYARPGGPATAGNLAEIPGGVKRAPGAAGAARTAAILSS
jgi:hypothetical protein